MKSENSCYTYFRIVGSFDPMEVSALLGLEPLRAWKIGDLRKDGARYDFASWEIGRCDKYDICVENQMRQTISPLLDKIDLLRAIGESNDVKFTLEIVPTVYAHNDSPCLAPSLDIIDFCHATRTEIDIDLYVLGEGDE